MADDDCDVLILGSGIAGLMSGLKLARIGLRVIIIEHASTIAPGASTRNVGWLHSGAYHAGSIMDRGKAISVARHCAYGHAQIIRQFPEVIEDDYPESHLLVRDFNRLAEICGRWSEVGLDVREISAQDLSAKHPSASFQGVSAIFKTVDVPINSRLLYRRMLHEARDLGVKILLGTNVASLTEDGRAQLVREGRDEKIFIRARIFIYATGHNTAEVVHRLLNISLPLRHWKSHMILTKRLTDRGIFHIDPGEAAIMHHGDISIVNLNDDAALCPVADYMINEEAVSSVRSALVRLFPTWSREYEKPVACIKSDLSYGAGESRSLEIEINEIRPGHFSILPGKMTETPYLTDALTRIVNERVDDCIVSLRPLDLLRCGSA